MMRKTATLVCCMLLVPMLVCASWTRTIVAEGHWFNQLQPDGLQTGSDQSVHMVYGGGHLFYRVANGTDETTEIVDTDDGTGDCASLALTSTNRPMIVYRDDHRDTLKFAWRDANQWQFVELATGVNVGRYNSIKADSLDNPHIVFSDDQTNTLSYKWRDSSGTWQTEIIDSLRQGQYCDLALYDNQPRVVYYDADSGNLMVAYRVGHNWQRKIFDSAENDGRFCSLSMQYPDVAMICYYNVTDQSVRYVPYDGESFGSSHVIDTATVISQMDMELDDHGRIHVIYSDNDASQCRVACGLLDDWNVQIVDENDNTGRWVAMALDSISSTCIRYVNSATGQLYLGSGNISAGWEMSPVFGSIQMGANSTIDQDSSGNPCSFFTEFPQQIPHYVTWSGNQWQMDAVPMEENLSSEYDFALYPDGRILIVSSDYDSTLRGHYFNGASWEHTDILSLPAPVRSINLAVSADNRVYIVCRPSGSGMVTYMECSTWNGEYSIEELVESEYGCDVAVDSQRRPHVVYATQYKMYHRWKTADGSWQNEEISDYTGRELTLELDSFDRPYVCSHGYYGSFRIIMPTEEGYDTESYSEGRNLHTDVAFSLDDADRPTVAFRYGDEVLLRYGVFDGSNWHMESPLGNEPVGRICLTHSPTTGTTIGCRSELTGDYLMITRPADVYYNLNLSKTMFSPDDVFELSCLIDNCTGNPFTLDEYIILDVMGQLWFWPSWSQSVDFNTVTLNPGAIQDHRVLWFYWPAGVGALDGIKFWGGILSSGTTNLLQFDSVQWGYRE